MANILKQSTQIKVRVGPFVDSTDAVTPETGVSLSTADQAELLKADGAATVDISGATWAAVTGADGWYDLTLTTSHTDTVGELVVVVQDSSVCLPVFARFQVVEEAIYDAMFAASATGLLPANVTQISGDSTAADNLEAALDGTGSVTISADLSGSVTNVTGGINTASGTITTLDALDTAQDSQHATTQAAIPSAGTVADAVLDEALSGHTTAGTLGKAIADIETDATAILADTAEIGAAGAGLTAIPWNAAWDAEVQSECTDALNAYDPPTNAEMEARTLVAASYATAAALTTVDNEIAVIDGIVDNLNLGIIYGSAQTGTLSTTQASTDLTGYADDQLIGRTVIWTSGACEGEASDITDYANTNGVLTFTDLTTAPGNGDQFKII